MGRKPARTIIAHQVAAPSHFSRPYIMKALGTSWNSISTHTPILILVLLLVFIQILIDSKFEPDPDPCPDHTFCMQS